MSISVISSPKNKKAFLSIGRAPARARTGIRKAFYYIGKEDVSVSRKQILKKNKTGRVYMVRLKGRTVRHRASAPGEFPANLSGALRKSIDFVVRGSNRMEFGARVPYAENLELGKIPGPGSAASKARPFLAKTVELTRRNAIVHMGREIKKSITS